MKKIMIFFLCFVLILTSTGVVSAYEKDKADESATEEITKDKSDSEDEDMDKDGDEDNDDEKDADGDQDEDDEDMDEEEIRIISASRENISFGTLLEGDKVEPIDFDISNDGNMPVDLMMIQTDAEDVFRVEVLSDTLELEPGQRLDCQLSLADGVKKGDYSCTIAFQDSQDLSCQTDISVSVKVIEKSSDKEEEQEDPEAEPEEEPEEDPDDEEENSSVTRYKVKAVARPKKGGYVAGTGTFKEGKSTVLTAFTNDGFGFDGWFDESDSVVSEKETLPIHEITSDLNYTAKFVRIDYKITVKSNNSDYGTVSGGGRFGKGDSTKIKAKPESGYVFKGWYEDGERISGEKTLSIKNIKSDRTLKAVFGSGSHKVTIDTYPVDAGEVTGEGKYKTDEDVTITAEPSDGYVFKGFFLNNQVITTKKKYTVKNIDRDLSFTAYFEKEEGKTYTMISGVANKGGVISPSGEFTIEEGGQITYTIAPEDGYAIQEVSVDGSKMGPVRTVSFKDISQDHQVSVSFAPKKNNVNHVKMDNIISTEEAKEYGSAKLFPATEDDEERSSTVITPEMYNKMKSEGTIKEVLSIQKQNVVGMDGTDGLGTEVDEYDYDSATGLFQIMDLNPDGVLEMIQYDEDDEIIKTAYEYGVLDIIINNQFLVPGKEEQANDIFEDNGTVKNLLEFVRGVLTTDEKMGMFEGKRVAVSMGITKGDDMSEEEKEKLEKAGAITDGFFYVTVMKKQEGRESEVVTKLESPVEMTVKIPEGANADCLVHDHDGKIEVLEDIDDNPNSVTVKTDSFSPYAFGQKKSPNYLVFIIGGGALILLAAIALFVFSRREKGEEE